MTLREETLRQIVEAAKAGWRCPDRSELSHTAVSQLVKDGEIRIEIYAGNWRVIEILTGPDKGLRTAERPGKRIRPWKVIDANGTQETRAPIMAGRPRRNQPSAPRLLRADEIR